MTQAQIKDFFEKISEANELERTGMDLQRQGWDLLSKTRLSCDHRNPYGTISGPEFEGSYCGFLCSICGGSVSYESMGY